MEQLTCGHFSGFQGGVLGLVQSTYFPIWWLNQIPYLSTFSLFWSVCDRRGPYHQSWNAGLQPNHLLLGAWRADEASSSLQENSSPVLWDSEWGKAGCKESKETMQSPTHFWPSPLAFPIQIWQQPQIKTAQENSDQRCQGRPELEQQNTCQARQLAGTCSCKSELSIAI